MSPPSVILRLELERTTPLVIIDALDESEMKRLHDWLKSQPALRSLVELAHELSERAA